AYCLKTQPATGETYPKSDLFNKAHKKINQTSTARLVAQKTNSIFSHRLLHWPRGCSAARR
ncbi:hypothetical protein, partial [Klebsiella quasipneumoniae]|uniref:hypothetical protein n=1 Tax=Klebsiella quasipneumoniae TaxID=1463165 RepID=UPI003975FCA4